MASGFTTALRNQILTAEFRTDNIWAACCDANPGDAGTAAAEISASYGYTRMTLSMATAATGSTKNIAAVEFPAAVTGTWGTIGWLAIATTTTEGDGKFSASGALTVSKLIGVGDQLVFAINAITVTIAAQA